MYKRDHNVYHLENKWKFWNYNFRRIFSYVFWAAESNGAISFCQDSEIKKLIAKVVEKLEKAQINRVKSDFNVYNQWKVKQFFFNNI